MTPDNAIKTSTKLLLEYRASIIEQPKIRNPNKNTVNFDELKSLVFKLKFILKISMLLV